MEEAEGTHQVRTLFYPSHLLHWRSLIPVACELVSRGHAITVQTTHAEWRGMPTFQMHWTPTRVTGVNKTSLAWLAGRMGYQQEWVKAQGCIEYRRHLAPKEDECVVSTTKDMDFLKLFKQEFPEKNAMAIGYQHVPVCLSMGRLAERRRYPDEMSPPFLIGHPFERLHRFAEVYAGNTAYPCGFPHLDKVQISHSTKQNAVLIQHPGGHRGISGHGWLVETGRVLASAGYRMFICPHFLPGFGYGADAIGRALVRASIPSWQIVKHWWDVAGQCDLILTTGSSAAYEMWAVGLTNIFILGYLGGTRHEKFQMFSDLLVESPEALGKLLRGLPGSAQATEALTREVMEAYRSVHNGRGAKTAADVIEGKV